MTLLSVVVPVHNVERYLAACLDSLRVQTLTDLEVVLVDDGSTDASTAIAEDFCARDSRFRLIRQENAGAGPARNRGVAAATGTYLGFVDADDLTHRAMYERLVGRLEESGSDFAVSRASRFSNLGQSPSMLHELAMNESVTGTHIDRRPNLVLDRMIWNTVYRRSFWDRAGEDGGALSYRAMMLQDYPVSLQAHIAASAVDVLDDCLYYWRERDGGDLSLTQRSNELSHVSDRFTSANLVLDLAEPRLPASLPILRRHLLEVDVHAIAGAMTTMAGEDRAAALGMAQRLVERLGPDAGANSPAFYQVQAAMVADGEDALLGELHAHARRYGKTAAVATKGLVRKRWYEAFPGFGTRPLPPYARKGGEPEPVASLLDATWTEDGLLEVAARIEGDGTRDVTSLVDPAALGGGSGFKPVLVEGRTLVGSTSARARFLPGRREHSVELQPVGRAEGFGIAVRRPVAVVDKATVGHGLIRLVGSVRGADVRGLLVGARRLPVEFSAGRFSAEIPVSDLADAPEHLAMLTVQTPLAVRLEVDGAERAVFTSASFRAVTGVAGHRMVTATRTANGMLEIVESRVAPIVDAVSWTSPASLRITGRWDGPQPLPDHVVLEHFERPGDQVELRVPLQTDGDRFAFDVDLPALPQATDPYLGRDLDPWHLVFRFTDHVNVPVLDRTAAVGFPAEVVLGRNDAVRLQLR